MKFRAYGSRLGLGILALTLVSGMDGGATVCAQGLSPMATASTAPLQHLSAEGETALRGFIDAGNLTDLHWPNFVDYEDQVKGFYDSGGYALAWVQAGRPTPQAVAIARVLQDADSKGLSADDYDGPRWAERIARLRQASPPSSDADLAKFDLAMTVCTMRYVSNLHIGRVNPKTLHLGLNVDGRKYDLSAFLRDRLVNADPQSVKPALARVEPPFDAYRRLAAALPSYEELASKDSPEQLPVPPRTVNPGDTYAGVRRLANLLRLVRDLPADASVSTDPPVYQQPLVDALKKFQGRHGLDADGRLGAQTVKQLNVPLSRRVVQIKLAMERWRWVPHHFSSPPIIVNIPEFILRCWDESDHNVLQMRVVVGKAYHHKTPVFSGDMRYVIFRPYWDVPPDIARAEMMPKIRKDPDYLAKNNFEVTSRDGALVSQGAVSGDVLGRIASGDLLVRQKPGPKNALGLVKFIFPNDYSVYLHSTEAPELFARSQRDFSHGCIRVQDPVALAVWVLRDQTPWDKEHIIAAMNDADNRRVNLTKAIPVLIVYGTAAVRPTGEVQFYDDIYGYDTELEEALTKAYIQ
jgi:murein L,D-transpeptidase YcbB/YkuD